MSKFIIYTCSHDTLDMTTRIPSMTSDPIFYDLSSISQLCNSIIGTTSVSLIVIWILTKMTTYQVDCKSMRVVENKVNDMCAR